MKKYITFLVLSVLSIFCAVAKRVAVVDAADLSPVVGATVFSSSGLILGVTDADGMTPDTPASSFPLNVRSLSYKEGIADMSVDTLEMVVDTYTLPEVTVVPGERPVVKVISYVREYATGATDRDTIKMFSEYMIETYNVAEKVKGYRSYDAVPKIKAVKRYAQYVGSENRDSVASPEDDEFISFMTELVMIPVSDISETDAMVNGAVVDTVMGKYSWASIYRKSDGIFTVTADALSNHKNHQYSPNIFKLIGFTMDMREMSLSYVYKANDRGSYSVHDLIYGVSSSNVLGRGKWIKKAFNTKNPVEMDCYLELYPVEINYLTVDEYKELRADRTKMEFRKPDNLQPLLPSVKRLIDRVNSL